MDIWLTTVLVVHVICALGIIVLVLLQHGKGADMGAAFGSGNSGSLFGATGSANFLSRTTSVLAAIFFSTSLTLAYLATNKPKADAGVMERGVMDTVPVPSQGAPAPQPDASVPTPGGNAGGAAGGTAPAGEKPKANDVPK
jgi:preprotein translocase subunit SecG